MTRTVACVWSVMCLASGTAFAEPPARISNAIPYRVTVPPATGRAGNATVFSRALLARDGTTTVEIATAPFATTPLDGISKIQVKALAPSDDVVFVRNANAPAAGGAIRWAFDDLVLAQPLRLDVHVDDHTSSRTEVVTVDDIVRRRPDVRVIALSIPRQTLMNLPV